MKKILSCNNMIEFIEDGTVVTRNAFKYAEEKQEIIQKLSDAHPDAVVEDENLAVDMQEFYSQENFDWTQSLIELSK